jgi:FAD/FMN-containing dehydrogenase
VLAAEVVLADGTRVRVDADQHPDLFWAIRGAGGNFGIVTALELGAYPLANVVQSTIVLDATDAAGLLGRWGALIEQAPRELTSFLYMFARHGAPAVAQIISVYAGDDTDTAIATLPPLLDIAPVLDQQAVLSPYAAIVPAHDATHHGGTSNPLFSNGFATHLTPDLTAKLAEGLARHVAPSLAIRTVGGAINDVPPTATAYAHRHQNFNVASIGASQEAFYRYWDQLRESLDGLYLSFETDPRPDRLHDAFPSQTLTRLTQVKATYDPENVFNQNFAIPPATEPRDHGVALQAEGSRRSLIRADRRHPAAARSYSGAPVDQT